LLRLYLIAAFDLQLVYFNSSLSLWFTITVLVQNLPFALFSSFTGLLRYMFRTVSWLLV
jgi:hypothetical protein